MGGRRRKQGRPRSIRQLRIEVVRKPEDQIDQHALSLALLAFHRQLMERRNQLADQAAADTTDDSKII